MHNKTSRTLFFGLFFVISFQGFSTNIEVENSKPQEKKFDAKEMIMHHVKDAHGFHLWDWNGHPVSLPLPIILWTGNGFTTFMSSAFQHDDSGKVIVEINGGKFLFL